MVPVNRKKGGEQVKRFMLVMRTNNGKQDVQFYDDYDNAVKGYNICVVVIGWDCELYTYEQNVGYTKIM